MKDGSRPARGKGKQAVCYSDEERYIQDASGVQQTGRR